MYFLRRASQVAPRRGVGAPSDDRRSPGVGDGVHQAHRSSHSCWSSWPYWSCSCCSGGTRRSCTSPHDEDSDYRDLASGIAEQCFDSLCQRMRSNSPVRVRKCRQAGDRAPTSARRQQATRGRPPAGTAPLMLAVAAPWPTSPGVVEVIKNEHEELTHGRSRDHHRSLHRREGSCVRRRLSRAVHL